MLWPSIDLLCIEALFGVSRTPLTGARAEAAPGSTSETPKTNAVSFLLTDEFFLISLEAKLERAFVYVSRVPEAIEEL